MARSGRPKALLSLTDNERDQLVRWSRRAKSAQFLHCGLGSCCGHVQWNDALAQPAGQTGYVPFGQRRSTKINMVGRSGNTLATMTYGQGTFTDTWVACGQLE